MIFVLDATNKALKFTVSAGTDVHFTSHWADATTSGLTEGQTQGTSNGSTAVDAVAAPAASTRRVVKLITFHNTNTTTSRTVTLVNDVGGTSRTIAVFSLAPLATWYSDTASTTAPADRNYGDITVSGSGATWTIVNDAVTTAKVFNDSITYAKIQNISATSRVLGRKSSGSGDTEECTLSEVLDFVGSAAQGDILYRDASTWTRLGAGTRGRYLQTGGTSANPSWATARAFKNVIINGDMQISQRGTTFTSTGSANNNDAYTLDRWYIQSQGTTDTGASRYADNVINVERDTDAPANATDLFESRINSLKMTVVSGANNRKFGIAQIVEQRSCRHLRGATVSLSFKAKVSSSNISDVRAAVLAWTGTADTVTSNIIHASTTGWNTDGNPPAYLSDITAAATPSNLNVGTSWATYTVSNLSISSSMNNLIVFIFNNDKTTTAGDALWITDVQLEPGPVATEFEYLPAATSTTLCQRYYETNYNSGVAPGSAVSIIPDTYSFITYYSLNFQTRKRSAPTITFYDSAGNANRVSFYDTQWRDNGTITTSGTSQAGLYVQQNNAGSLIAAFMYAASSEL